MRNTEISPKRRQLYNDAGNANQLESCE